MTKKKIELATDLREVNRREAEAVRTKLAENRVLAVNLIGSPGCGKTSILETTIPMLEGVRSAVIEGDIATRRDADRIVATGVTCVQINTGGGCHLLARQVREVVEEMELANLDVLFIENVGNLVCPSTTDLGEDHKVAVLSVPEGDDKVAKYPRLFREASCVLLNKADLLGVVRFDLGRVREDLAQIKADLLIMEVAATSGAGMDAWVGWLRKVREAKQTGRSG
jgi:hydrogenase nickel incorporation protein HypB